MGGVEDGFEVHRRREGEEGGRLRQVRLDLDGVSSSDGRAIVDAKPLKLNCDFGY